MHDTAKRSAIQGLKRSVRAVVFDYGSVLGLEQTLEDMKRMALMCGIPHERFSELYELGPKRFIKNTHGLTLEQERSREWGYYTEVEVLSNPR